MQQKAFVWMITMMGPLEGRARELRDRTRGKMDLMVLDLRVRRGADPPPDARVLAEARLFSRGRPRSIVSHMDDIGYPVSYGEPQVALILSKCEVLREADTMLICCVGDSVPPGGGPLPPNFSHSFLSTCFDQLREIRSALAKPARPKERPEPEAVWRTRDARLACGNCGTHEGKMLSCAGCGQVRYCGRLCQKQAWSQHKEECRKYQKVAADVDAMGQKMSESASLRVHTNGKEVVKHLSGAGLDAMITPEDAAAFQVKVEQFANVMVREGYLSKLVWGMRCNKFVTAGALSADVVRRKGLDGTRKILCMIKNAAFEDWLARHMKSLELVGRACSEIEMTLLDEDDVRLCKGKGMTGVDVLSRQLRNPDFDPKEGFLCMFIDPSYGPYADATLIVRWDLRFEREAP